MSLINKMLQDLDARGTPSGDSFPSHVKPVAASERRAPALRLAALAVGGVLAAGAVGAVGWFAWDHLHAPHAVMPAATAAPAARNAATAKPAPAMTSTITQLPVTKPGEAAPAAAAPAPAPATPAAAPMAAAPAVTATQTAPAATPLPLSNASAVPAAPAHAAGATAPEEGAAPAPRARAHERAPERTHERTLAHAPAREAEAAEAEPAQPAPKSVLPMEPDSLEAREARKAAAIELATRQTRLARLARLSAPGATPKTGAGHKASAGLEGRQESPAQRAENEYRRALSSLQDGRMTEALASLQLALRIDPGHDAARQTLVGLLVETNRPDDAMRELQTGLAEDPRQPALAMLLARLQIERGGSGIDTLTRSLPYVGSGTADGAEYRAFLAGALQRQGRQREAAEQYQQALRVAPANGVWWMGLGISLQADKRNAEALDAFQRARAGTGLTPELQAFVERRIQQLGR